MASTPLARRCIFWLAVPALLASASVAPGARSAHAHATISRIVFTRDIGGIPELFTIGADGRGLRQLTNTAYGAEHAAWSPDGKKLVFVLRGLSTGLIYRMDSDGGGLRRLSPPCRGGCIGDGFPNYSPRGSKIVFERDFAERSGGAIGVALFTVSSEGSDLTQLTPVRRTTEDHEAQWLHNGKIAFTRLVTGGADAGAGALFEIDSDRTHLRQLTQFSRNYPSDAKWSPNGKAILFDTYSDAEPSKPTNLFTMSPDGTNEKQLTYFTGTTIKAFAGAWSPDGNWIVWHQSGPGTRSQLFLMNRRGQHLSQLTQLPAGAKPQSPPWAAPAN